MLLLSFIYSVSCDRGSVFFSWVLLWTTSDNGLVENGAFRVNNFEKIHSNDPSGSWHLIFHISRSWICLRHLEKFDGLYPSLSNGKLKNHLKQTQEMWGSVSTKLSTDLLKSCVAS